MDARNIKPIIAACEITVPTRLAPVSTTDFNAELSGWRTESSEGGTATVGENGWNALSSVSTALST